MTAEIIYQGELRCQAAHLASGQTLVTDAPTDNNGRGEAFSPTDLVAAALVCCMQTVVGIQIEKGALPPLHMAGKVLKTMAAAPRRIQQLDVVFNISGANLTQAQRHLLQTTALNCPVAKSLNEHLIQNVTFHYA